MLFTLLPDLNVAPLKYRYVHREHGGPLASVTAEERGPALFAATATLENGARGEAFGPTWEQTSFDAISRAMAEWAWKTAERDPALAATLRFDLDPSSFGFAAFPGLGVQGAKKRAYFAAVEAWALEAWWNGGLGHIRLENAVQITLPFPGVALVVQARRDGYAAAAAHHVAAAFAKLPFALPRRGPASAAWESRLAAKPHETAAPPKLAVDLAVIGPWQPYAHVWRCLFDGPKFREKVFA